MAFLDDSGVATLVSLIKAKIDEVKNALSAKQDLLVSGSSIKTINYASLLGSGNISLATSDIVGREIGPYSDSLASSDGCSYNRLFLTSADGAAVVPINTSTSPSTSTTKTFNTRPIDPFGKILYYTTSVNAGSSLLNNLCWLQYNLDIRYSYVVSMTSKRPVYLKCTPQSDGSAIMVDIVQTLPSSSDGFIYIFLGESSTSTNLSLQLDHPVYCHDGTGIRLWTGSTQTRVKGNAESSYRTGDVNLTPDNIGALSLSGGTLTGNATVSKDSGSTGFYAESTNTGTKVSFIVGNSGINHGVYSDSMSKWLIYGDGTNVYVDGKNITNLGTIVTSAPSAVTVDSSTWTTLGSITLEAGTWVVTVGDTFASNTSGRRATYFGTSSSGSTVSISDAGSNTHAPANGGMSKYISTAILKPTGSTTYYCRAWQNSSSSLSCQCHLRAVRIA